MINYFRNLTILVTLLMSLDTLCQINDNSNKQQNGYVLNIDTSKNNYNRGRIKDLTFLINLFPDNYEHYFNRGYSYLSLNDYEKALNDFDKAFKLNSNIQNIINLRLKTYAIKNVLSWLNNDLRKTDSFTPVQFDEFFLQNYSQQIEKLLGTKSKIKYSIVFNYIINDSLIKGTYFHLDSSLNVIGKLSYSEMVKLTLAILPLNDVHKETDNERLKRASDDIRKEPGKWINYSIRAGAKDELGDTIGAIEDYEKAIELIPKEKESYYDDLPLLYNNLGYLKFQIGEVNIALNLIDKAIDYNPNYAYAYLFRGRIKCKVGKLDSGCVDIKKAIELDAFMIEDGMIKETEMNDCNIKK